MHPKTRMHEMHPKTRGHDLGEGGPVHDRLVLHHPVLGEGHPEVTTQQARGHHRPRGVEQDGAAGVDVDDRRDELQVLQDGVAREPDEGLHEDREPEEQRRLRARVPGLPVEREGQGPDVPGGLGFEPTRDGLLEVRDGRGRVGAKPGRRHADGCKQNSRGTEGCNGRNNMPRLRRGVGGGRRQGGG